MSHGATLDDCYERHFKRAGVAQRIDNQVLGLATDRVVTKRSNVDIADVVELTRGLGMYLDSSQRHLMVVSNVLGMSGGQSPLFRSLTCAVR
jgi:hypothetical protein